MAHQQAQGDGLGARFGPAFPMGVNAIEDRQGAQVGQDGRHVVVEGDLAALDADHDAYCGDELGEGCHAVDRVEVGVVAGSWRHRAFGEAVELLACGMWLGLSVIWGGSEGDTYPCGRQQCTRRSA